MSLPKIPLWFCFINLVCFCDTGEHTSYISTLTTQTSPILKHEEDFFNKDFLVRVNKVSNNVTEINSSDVH